MLRLLTRHPVWIREVLSGLGNDDWDWWLATEAQLYATRQGEDSTGGGCVRPCK